MYLIFFLNRGQSSSETLDESPKSRDVPTQTTGHRGHSVSKTTEKGALHKVFPGHPRAGVMDILMSGSLMCQGHPAQTLCLQADFCSILNLRLASGLGYTVTVGFYTELVLRP